MNTRVTWVIFIRVRRLWIYVQGVKGQLLEAI